MSTFRILYQAPDGPGSIIVEASSKRSARSLYLRQNPNHRVTAVVLVPE